RRGHPAWPLQHLRRCPRLLPQAARARRLRGRRRHAGGPGLRHDRAAALHPAAPAAAVGTGGNLRRPRLPRGPARRARRRRVARRAAGKGLGKRMHASISAGQLFEQLRERLDLRWIAGESGRGNTLEAVDTVARRPSLAGYLNAIYPNKVQILGTEELSWLDTL